jgi:hypothetical protein
MIKKLPDRSCAVLLVVCARICVNVLITMTLMRGLSAIFLGRVPSLVPPRRQLQQDAWLQRLVIDYLGRLEAAERRLHSLGERMIQEDAAAILRCQGFHLDVQPSSIPGAGRGVFLTAGSCAVGSVLTLYPGLMLDMAAFLDQLAATAQDDAYAPTPPPFALHNHYLLQLNRGGGSVLIDGRPKGLSAQRFMRAAAGGRAAVNASWLCLGDSIGDEAGPSCRLRLQAALGSMINHGAGAAANAVFDLALLPPHTSPKLVQLVPSLDSGSTAALVNGVPRWVPLLRACRNISANNAPVELLVDYGANPASLGFNV